MRLWC